MEVDRRHRSLVVIDGLLDPRELDRIAREVASLDFAPQDLGRGVIRARLKADLVVPGLGDRLWDRLAPVLDPPVAWFDPADPPVVDPPIDRWRWTGTNPKLRCYRYEPGAEFRPHTDESWRPDLSRRSLLTVLVSLPCGGCEGGETVVGDEVVPTIDGRVTIFDHRILHAGRPVERGTKLILRTDLVAAASGG